MKQSGMQITEVLALPVTVDLETAGRALALGRTTSYQQAKAGTFPVPVLRVGTQYRVARAELLRILGIVDAPAASAA